MNDFDYLAIDGRGLSVFLAVLEEGSVTAAAERLGVTQSAVSHTLEKLREILNDPLFVKSGRGIVATAHAHHLAPLARLLLEDMKTLARGASFDPAAAVLELTVAANDFQRDLLLPAFHQRISAQVKELRMRVVPSGVPSAEILRERRCDLIITPRPPVGTDILQKRLLADRFVCFYDESVRKAPRTLTDYQSARHIMVTYERNERMEFDRVVQEMGIVRPMAVTVSSFAGVATFLRGSDLLASLPGLLHRGLMAGFAKATLPFKYPELPMYMVWHQRHQTDPAHRWLRGQLETVTQEILSGLPEDQAK